MNTKVESAYRILAWVVFAAVVLEFFLAGLSVWEAAGFGSHELLGWLILAAAVALLVLALWGRLGRERVGPAASLVALVVLTAFLAAAGGLSPFLGALHPVAAGAVTVVSYVSARAHGSPAGGESGAAESGRVR